MMNSNIILSKNYRIKMDGSRIDSGRRTRWVVSAKLSALISGALVNLLRAVWMVLLNSIKNQKKNSLKKIIIIIKVFYLLMCGFLRGAVQCW